MLLSNSTFFIWTVLVFYTALHIGFSVLGVCFFLIPPFLLCATLQIKTRVTKLIFALCTSFLYKEDESDHFCSVPFSHELPYFALQLKYYTTPQNI